MEFLLSVFTLKLHSHDLQSIGETPSSLQTFSDTLSLVGTHSNTHVKTFEHTYTHKYIHEHTHTNARTHTHIRTYTWAFFGIQNLEMAQSVKATRTHNVTYTYTYKTHVWVFCSFWNLNLEKI